MTSECADGPCSQRKVWERLKAYEDTGLESEDLNLSLNAAIRKKVGAEYYGLAPAQMDRAADLLHAEQEGRLVVLPCKVGDTVWTNTSVLGDRYRKADRPYPVKVVFIGMGAECVYFHVEYSNARVFPFEFDQFGKTVFLSREEAEASLAKDNDVLATDMNVGRTKGGGEE